MNGEMSLHSAHMIYHWATTVLHAAELKGIPVRLLGGAAIWERCDKYRTFMKQELRSGDVDFVLLSKNRVAFESLLRTEFSLLQDPQLGSIPGETHNRFYTREGKHICDVFYDKLAYCHDIDLRSRLEVDKNTIPLAELTLSKLQIVELNDKDTFDLVALLNEHSFSDRDGDFINTGVIVDLCSSNWGLEHTVHQSLYQISVATHEIDFLDDRQKLNVLYELCELSQALACGRKSIGWQLRSLQGEKRQWYRRVETLPDPDFTNLLEGGDGNV